jgi:hypothetical protein
MDPYGPLLTVMRLINLKFWNLFVNDYTEVSAGPEGEISVDITLTTAFKSKDHKRVGEALVM